MKHHLMGDRAQLDEALTEAVTRLDRVRRKYGHRLGHGELRRFGFCVDYVVLAEQARGQVVFWIVCLN